MASDKTGNFAIYNHPSTFSYLGRHGVSLGTLVDHLDNEPRLVLDLGCGLLEPFLLAEHILERWPSAETMIEAIDVDHGIQGYLGQLLAGESIPLSELVETMCNINDDGTKRPNADIGEAERLALGIRDYMLAGLDPAVILDDSHERFRYLGDGGRFIIPVEASLIEHVRNRAVMRPGEQVDLAYAGTVFVNILKNTPLEDVVAAMKDLHSLMAEHSLFGIGTTPFGLYGESSEILALAEAGFSPAYWAAESLVVPGKRLFGDYGIVSTPAPRALLAQEDIDAVDARIDADGILKGMGTVRRDTISQDELLSHLLTDEKGLYLAGVRLPSGEYRVWEADREEILRAMPDKRYPLNLIKSGRFDS